MRTILTIKEALSAKLLEAKQLICLMRFLNRCHVNQIQHFLFRDHDAADESNNSYDAGKGRRDEVYLA